MIPFGGYICKEELYEAAYGSIETCFHHTATYQENGISAAADLASLEYILEHDLISAAAEKGDYYTDAINNDLVDIYRIQVNHTINNPAVFRFLPPLTIKKEDLDYVAEAFEKSVKKIYETVNG